MCASFHLALHFYLIDFVDFQKCAATVLHTCQQLYYLAMTLIHFHLTQGLLPCCISTFYSLSLFISISNKPKSKKVSLCFVCARAFREGERVSKGKWTQPHQMLQCNQQRGLQKGSPLLNNKQSSERERKSRRNMNKIE